MGWSDATPNVSSAAGWPFCAWRRYYPVKSRTPPRQVHCNNACSLLVLCFSIWCQSIWNQRAVSVLNQLFQYFLLFFALILFRCTVNVQKCALGLISGGHSFLMNISLRWFWYFVHFNFHASTLSWHNKKFDYVKDVRDRPLKGTHSITRLFPSYIQIRLDYRFMRSFIKGNLKHYVYL